MTVKELSQACGFRIIAEADLSREVCSCYAGDLLSWVMGHGEYGNAWVTIMSNKNVIAVASLLEFSCVILAEGTVPDNDFIELAKEKEINILSSSRGTYEICVEVSKALQA